MKSTPVQENRRWHLRQIMKAVGGNNAVAAKLDGVSTSYITIVAGPTPSRNIGDRTAAKIEKAFNLPPGSLDLPPPEETKDADPYLAQISATLANVGDSHKELVLSIAQWVADRALAPSPAVKNGSLQLKEFNINSPPVKKVTDNSDSSGNARTLTARGGLNQRRKDDVAHGSTNKPRGGRKA
jgi:hypothetical protein